VKSSTDFYVSRDSHVFVRKMAERLVSLQLRCFHMRVLFSSYWRVFDEAMMRNIETQMQDATREIEQETDLDELARWQEMLSLMEEAVGVLEQHYQKRRVEGEAREEEEEMTQLVKSVASM
jgi:hypothetical protein